MNTPTFVHLSDIHVVPEDAESYGTDTAENLRVAAARIREMELNPAFILMSGDLTGHGEPESYAHLKRIIAEEFDSIGAPVLLGLGNHDERVPFRQVMQGETDANDEYEPFYYAQWFDDLRVLMLDSKIPGRVHGTLGETQLNWLAAELSEPAPGGDLIVLHHPCVPRGVPRPDDYLLLDSDDLANVITRAPGNVLGILCGHSHVGTASVFAGVLHVAAPATAFMMDPSRRAGGRGLDGAGFNICTVRDGRLVVNSVPLPSSQRELFAHNVTFTAMPEREPVASGRA
jgi:3',5'-cyclic AMP phosphodiesterase CpdA